MQKQLTFTTLGDITGLPALLGVSSVAPKAALILVRVPTVVLGLLQTALGKVGAVHVPMFVRGLCGPSLARLPCPCDGHVSLIISPKTIVLTVCVAEQIDIHILYTLIWVVCSAVMYTLMTKLLYMSFTLNDYTCHFVGDGEGGGP